MAATESWRAVMPRDVALFPSCAAEIADPDGIAAGMRVLGSMGAGAGLLPDRTCCGWLALRAGRRGPAALLAKRWILAYEPRGAVVGTSGACVAMVHRHYPGLLRGHWRRRAAFMATRTFELSRFAESFGAPDGGAEPLDGCALGTPGRCSGLREIERERGEPVAPSGLASRSAGEAVRFGRVSEHGSIEGHGAAEPRFAGLSLAGTAWWVWAITWAVPRGYARSVALVRLVARVLPRAGRARWLAAWRRSGSGAGAP